MQKLENNNIYSQPKPQLRLLKQKRETITQKEKTCHVGSITGR